MERPVFIEPPASLLSDCVERYVEVNTNGDLYQWVESLRNDIKICSADKAGLRKWVEEMKSKH